MKCKVKAIDTLNCFQGEVVVFVIHYMTPDIFHYVQIILTR